MLATEGVTRNQDVISTTQIGKNNHGPKVGRQKAHCDVCNKDCRVHHADLEKHGSMATHLQNMERIHVKQKKITNYQTDSKNENKIRDIKLALFLACHSSIKSADHLCEVLRNLKMSDLRLRRTKLQICLKKSTRCDTLWETINIACDDNGEFLKKFHFYVKLANMRWLERYNAVKLRIKNLINATLLGRYQLCLIIFLYYYLYLRIIKPILFEGNEVNILFQSGSVNINLKSSYVSDNIEELAKTL
ncbi:hypothetical protein TSAR_013995 [Trichomalopsis sarcophagae]|uniref:Uncharacterized protein n=1 Tax=Trichomalopsis sarcophagae TaxID=543379 RepID=A0A232FD83_9HYME|nr:hypothetical protein TSAR_013995 [Trichomalopsis sarcophagae]